MTPPPVSAVDAAFMQRALALAARQLGHVAPNPSVGCLVVRDGVVIAEAATGNGGRPHAEEQALQMAGASARGATIYVTLEPCTRRTSGAPSCADRLAAAHPARVVIACTDPNPAAAQGRAYLEQKGVSVELGLLEADAQALNAGFFKLLRTGRPLVTVTDKADSHDQEFARLPGESIASALDRLGAGGVTRVYVRPSTADAQDLADAGLVDCSDIGSPA